MAWLAGAVVAEAFSLWARARLQWLLLQAGDVEIGTVEMTELTAAHNAITMSVCFDPLPGRPIRPNGLAR